MTNRTLPPQAYLIQCFDYDAITGELRWKVRPEGHFKSTGIAQRWNEVHAGKPAGRMCKRHGYVMCTIMRVKCRAHRVIWKIKTGEDPDTIDHINGVKSDNSWDNLRSCSITENNRNTTPVRLNNTSGAKGVHPCNGRWRAMIRINNKSHHIGMFDTVEDASRAYNVAAEKSFGDFVRQT